MFWSLITNFKVIDFRTGASKKFPKLSMVFVQTIVYWLTVGNCAKGGVVSRAEFCALLVLALCYLCLMAGSGWPHASSSAWTLPRLTVSRFPQQRFPLHYFADFSVCFPSSLPLLSANSVPSTASLMQQAPFLGLSLLVSHCIAPETLAKHFLWWAGSNCCTKMADYSAVYSTAASLAPHQMGRGDGALHIIPHMHNIGIYPHPSKAQPVYSSHDYTYMYF